MIEPGLYERLVTEALRDELQAIGARFTESSRSLHTAEAADRIALHLSRRIQRTLESVGDSDRVRVGIEVARDLIARLAKIVDSDFAEAPCRARHCPARRPRTSARRQTPGDRRTAHPAAD